MRRTMSGRASACVPGPAAVGGARGWAAAAGPPASSRPATRIGAAGPLTAGALRLEAPEDGHGVLATEAEPVDHRRVHARLARHEWDVGEVALGPGRVLAVARGRDDLFTDGPDGGERAHRARGAPPGP